MRCFFVHHFHSGVMSSSFERVKRMLGCMYTDLLDNIVFVIHLPCDRVVRIMFAEDVPYKCDIPLDKMLALIQSMKNKWRQETSVNRNGRKGWALTYSFTVPK